MHVTQYARRSLVAAGLALAAAACGKDNGPSEFDPQGTSADMVAAQDAFVSGPTASFTAVSTQITAALGGSPLVATAATIPMTKSAQIAARYVKQMAALVPNGRHGIQASFAAVPGSYLGVTFVWDENTDSYVQSELEGAPATGVRFMLYAVDPVTLQVVEPAVATGYVDVTDQSTETTLNFRVKVIEAGVTYLDYAVVGNGGLSGALVTVSGFAYNGSTLANFTLKNTVSENAGGLVLSLDYDLNVPSRGVSLNWTATFANISDTQVVVTLDLGISGPNGQVRLVGTYGTDGGSFSVKVNGDLFATITFSESGQTVTGAGGQALTADEEATLHDIMAYYDLSLVAFGELVLPLGG